MAPRAGLASAAGLPDDAGTSIWLTNAWPNIAGWNCSAASVSHASPSAICSPRRTPADSRSAVQPMIRCLMASARIRRPGPVTGGFAGTSAGAKGRKSVANASSDPAAVTHRPGPPRASTIESPPSVLIVAASWMSR